MCSMDFFSLVGRRRAMPGLGHARMHSEKKNQLDIISRFNKYSSKIHEANTKGT